MTYRAAVDRCGAGPGDCFWPAQIKQLPKRRFKQAIEVARHQNAKMWELRGAASLARLWRRQGRYAEARDLLAPVYGWFAEGLDVRDLADARELLVQLE